MGYAFVAVTVLLTVYGQLVLKWQVGLAGMPPDGFAGKAAFLGSLLLNPWVISGLAAAFGAALAWMMALTRLPLSTAYPFTSASFVLVLVFGALFLGEMVSSAKILGTLLIVAGIVVMAIEG